MMGGNLRRGVVDLFDCPLEKCFSGEDERKGHHPVATLSLTARRPQSEDGKDSGRQRHLQQHKQP